MEDDEMNETTQQSARIRDCFLDRARQHLLAGPARDDSASPHNGGARTATQALDRSCSGPQPH